MVDQEWAPRSALFVYGAAVGPDAPQRATSVFEDKDMTKRFVEETGKAGEIARLIEPAIEELGFLLVRVKVSGRDGCTLQVMAERANGDVGIEDCAKISRWLSPLLDAHDPFPQGYRLEVSSPGIDRPLVRPRDFEDWTGYEAKIELKELIDGRKRFRGTIDGFQDDEVRLHLTIEDGEEPIVVGFPMGLIADAKLVLSDDLLKAARAGTTV